MTCRLSYIAPLVIASAALLASCDSGGGGTEPPPDRTIARVEVTPASDTLDLGEQKQFSARASDANGFTVSAEFTWSSSNPSVASVSSTGLVTAEALGVAAISATASGKTGISSVVVIDPNPPAAPSELLAEAASHDEVKLSWADNSPNEEEFRIQRQEVGEDQDFRDLATVEAGVTQFRNRRLTPEATYRYRVQACNAFGCSSFPEPAEVTTDAVLAIVTDTLPRGLVDDPYQTRLRAEGGNGSYDWTVTDGALPDGVELSEGGTISGTPADSGSYVFTAAVMSNEQVQEREFTLRVDAGASEPVVTTDSLPQGTAGKAYETRLEAAGGDGVYAWSITSGGLPQGLQFSSTGRISGTPARAGTSDFTVEVRSGGFSSTADLSLTVVWDSLTVLSSQFSPAFLNVEYLNVFSARGGDGDYTWSIIEGALPEGMTLTPETGFFRGVATELGTSAFTVQVESGDGQVATRELQLRVIPPPVTITTESLPDARLAQPYTFTLEAVGGVGTYQWSINGLPAGLTVNAGSGVISGTPTEAGSFPIQVLAVSGTGENQREGTANLVLRVQDDLQIVTGALKPGIEFTPYADTLRASGASGVYTWSRVGGSLPSGISLSTSGVLSGTPVVTGAFAFTARVTSDGQTRDKALTLVVDEVDSPPVIVTSELATATVGVFHADTLEASGGSGFYEWSSASAVPPGLVLTSGGVLSGVPVEADTVSLSLTVTSGGLTDTRSLTLRIHWDTLSISTTSLADIPFQNEFADTLVGYGGDGDYEWSVSEGELPEGVELNDSTGVLSGYATELGTSTFTVRLESGDDQEVFRQYTLEVVPGPVNIVSDSLRQGKFGRAYADTLEAEGGNGTFVWSLASSPQQLHAGLTLNASSGIISGTPTEFGPRTLVFTASSPGIGISGQRVLQLVIQAPLEITTDTLPNGVQGEPYGAVVSASGGAGGYSFQITAGALPAGLTLNVTNGVVSGTPTEVGNFTVTVQVTAQDGDTETDDVVISIFPVLSITAGALPGGVTGTAYSQTLQATGGDGEFVWSVAAGALPGGLSLDPGSGVISGTPTGAGTFDFTVAVASGDGQEATAARTILVADP